LPINFDASIRIQEEIEKEKRIVIFDGLLYKINKFNEDNIDFLNLEEIEKHPIYDAFMEIAFNVDIFTDTDEYRNEVSVCRVISSSVLCELIAIDERVNVEDEKDPQVERISIQLTVNLKKLLEIYENALFIETEVGKM
jgi:hypothetical protein